VLVAMGFGELSGCALRLALGRSTTEADVDAAAARVGRAVSRIRSAGAATGSGAASAAG
jgi:cysteine sulfinate desulfinase/cysteine desulfurase-like protein